VKIFGDVQRASPFYFALSLRLTFSRICGIMPVQARASGRFSLEICKRKREVL